MDDVQEPNTEDVQEIEEELADREARIQELESDLQERDQRILDLEAQIERLNELLEQQSPPTDIQKQAQFGDPAPAPTEQIQEVVEETIEDYIEEFEATEELTVEVAQSTLRVTHRTEPVTVTTDTLIGKVAYLYAEGELPEDKWFTTGDMEDYFAKNGWDDDVKGTDVLNEMCRMGFFEMQYSGRRRDYRLRMTPEEAQQKGLLEMEVKTT